MAKLMNAAAMHNAVTVSMSDNLQPTRSISNVYGVAARLEGVASGLRYSPREEIVPEISA